MASLKELLDQKAALEAEIDVRQREERGSAIEKIRALMAEYGLTAADLEVGRVKRPRAEPGTGASSAGNAPKVAPKYRNAQTGETWSGRGLQPNWLKAAISGGATLQDFSIVAG